MSWCRRCGKRFDRTDRSNIKKPTLCSDCARVSERKRINKVKHYYKDNHPEPYWRKK